MSSGDSAQAGLSLRPFEAKMLGALLRSFEPDIMINYDILQAQLGYKTKRSAQSGWSHLKRKIMDSALASGLSDENNAKKARTNNATDAGTNDAHEDGGGDGQQMAKNNERVANNKERMANNIGRMNSSNGHIPIAHFHSVVSPKVSASRAARHEGPGDLWLQSLETTTHSAAISSPKLYQQKHQ